MISKNHPDLKYLKIKNSVGLRIATTVKIHDFLITKKKYFFRSAARRALNTPPRNKIRRTSLYKTVWITRSRFNNWTSLVWTAGFRILKKTHKFWTFGVGVGGKCFAWTRLEIDKRFNLFFINNTMLRLFFTTFRSIGCELHKTPAPMKISYITVRDGTPKYARAPGVEAFVKFHIFKTALSLIFLPSKQKKLFEFSNFFFKSRVWGTFLRSFKNARAGFYQQRGSKVRVRGVAKNPVDHPHGGRTNTLVSPVSPWGWITKKK